MLEPSITSHPGAGWRGEPLMPPLDEAECLPAIVEAPSTPAPVSAGADDGFSWGCPLAGAAVFFALLLALVIWGVWHDARHGMEGY